MALHLTKDTQIQPEKPFDNPSFNKINTNQEDIDLLVAFDSDGMVQGKTHPVLIEAKDYLHWGRPQLDHKVVWLECIFGRDGRRHPTVIPQFILMTGHEPRNIGTAPLSQWKREPDRPFLLKYGLQPRLKITRCSESDEPSEVASQLRLDPMPQHTL